MTADSISDRLARDCGGNGFFGFELLPKSTPSLKGYCDEASFYAAILVLIVDLLSCRVTVSSDVRMIGLVYN